MTLQQRILGGLYGSLVGDALGVPVEFSSRDARQRDPVTGMRGHGVHNQPAGTWSDDGSLLLCAAASFAEKADFDPQDMGVRFLQWFDLGYWGAHGRVFDIGNATRKALDRISLGTPALQAGGTDSYDNGNGSLMRILPVVLASLRVADDLFVMRLEEASAITHGHARSKMACVFFGFMVRALVKGTAPQEALLHAQGQFAATYRHSDEFSHFAQVMKADLGAEPGCKIDSGGYVIDTLTASLWCLLTTRNFSDCVLKAVNLGSDTDTTGCVAGGLAGVVYGLNAIPAEWQLALPRQNDLRELFQRFTGTLSLA